MEDGSMTKQNIITAIEGIKKGTFVHIVYETELPMTAAARKKAISILKRTEKVVRVGVDYNNIEAVKKIEEQRTEPKQERAPWCHWEIPHILAKHNTKDDYYLSVATVNHGAHTKTTYIKDGNVISLTEVKKSECVLPSYFKSSSEIPVVQTINIKNIIELGGVNEKEKRKINI